MIKYKIFLFCYFLSVANLMANSIDDGFVLAEAICAYANSGSPILRSDVSKRASEAGFSFKDALNELLKEEALFLYAKNQLKFNLSEIYQAAESHIKKVMETNKLSREKFDALLEAPPYNTTFAKYRKQTAYLILKNQVESHLAAQIQISDQQKKAAELKYKREQSNQEQAVFISIGRQSGANKNNELNWPTETAKKIKQQILHNKSLDELKKIYGPSSQVSFSGPIDYKKGTFKELYEKKISENKSLITEPFVDEDNNLTIIWRIKKVQELSAETLEQLQKDLYESQVKQKLDNIIYGFIADITVTNACY